MHQVVSGGDEMQLRTLSVVDAYEVPKGLSAPIVVDLYTSTAVRLAGEFASGLG